MAEKYAMKIDADEFILQLLYAGIFSQPMLVSRRVPWIFSFLSQATPTGQPSTDRLVPEHFYLQEGIVS